MKITGIGFRMLGTLTKAHRTQYTSRFALISHFFIILSLLATFLVSGCAAPPVHHIDIPDCPPHPKPIKNVEVALALGIGGFRGLAHLGVIEVLEREGVPIDLIVGSSVGSLVGAFYGDTPNCGLLKSKLMHIKKHDILDFCMRPLPGKKLEQFMLEHLCARNFEELKIPLVAVTTCMKDNTSVLLRSGPIAPAIHASSALPYFFRPVKIYHKTLIDGGVSAPVPVKAARQFNPKMVIAVNITAQPINKLVTKKNDMLFRAIDISFYEFSRMQAAQADISIQPNLVGYGTFDDQCNQAAYERGKEAAIAAMPAIKRIMREKGIQTRFRR